MTTALKTRKKEKGPINVCGSSDGDVLGILGSSKGAGERVIVLPDISHYPFSSQRGAEHQRGNLKSLSLLTSTYLQSVVSLPSARANSCNSEEELLTVLSNQTMGLFQRAHPSAE